MTAETPPTGLAASSDLDALCHALGSFWPQPVQTQITRVPAPMAPGATEFIVVPNRRHPVMLLPAGSHQAAAAAAARWGSGAGLRAWAKQRALVTSLRWGLADRLLPDRVTVTPSPVLDPGTNADLADFLSAAIGRRVLLAVRVGSLRANRKPVLQAVTPDGTVLAFVKVGHDPLTRQLVRAEAEALVAVHNADLASVVAPVPLFLGTWNSLDLLVMTPLPWVRARRQVPPLPVAALRDVAAIGASSATLEQAPFWQNLMQRAEAITPEVRGDLVSTLQGLAKHYGDLELPLGSWHGDWTPWNMVVHGPAVLLWDWERFSPGVPHGFDALHYRLNDLRIVRGLSMSTAIGKLYAETPDILRALGLPPHLAKPLPALYLAELATRYLDDGQHPSGSKVRQHGIAVANHLRSLTERSSA